MALLMGLLTGMAYGTVFYKVGAVRYSRIIGAVSMTDSKIVKFIFGTIGFASIFYGAASIFGLADSWNLAPRIMPWLGPAHLIGGIIFGVTLAFSGFCPAACVARAGYGAGTKKFATISAFIGLLAGVAVFGYVKDPMIAAGLMPERPVPITLHGALGISYGYLAIPFGLLFLTMAMYIDRKNGEFRYEPLHPPRGMVDRVRGEWGWMPSAFLGAVVIVWATSQDGYLGFSGGILALFAYIGDGLGLSLDLVPAVNDTIIWRAGLVIGLAPGALLASFWSLPTKDKEEHKTTVPSTFSVAENGKAFVLGGGLSLGAMIGGGCTTGAFMAAFPTLSVGSFAMAATFFVVSKVVGYSRFRNHQDELQQIRVVGDRIYN